MLLGLTSSMVEMDSGCVNIFLLICSVNIREFKHYALSSACHYLVSTLLATSHTPHASNSNICSYLNFLCKLWGTECSQKQELLQNIYK